MKKRIVVVSLFSGQDLWVWALWQKLGLIPAFACEKYKWIAKINEANFRHQDGTPLIKWLEVDKPDLTGLEPREVQDVKDCHFCIDGRYYRPRTIQDISGHQIREEIETYYGKDVVIVVVGGPPCPDFSGLNHGGDQGRRELLYEFLRIVDELQPEVAIMEEVKLMLAEKHKDVFDEFKYQLSLLNYRTSLKVMNAINYPEGRQWRERAIIPMVRNDLNKAPVFPKAYPEQAKRAGDLMELDSFFSGHFTDSIKYDYDFIPTVTSGSPLWYRKNGIKKFFTVRDYLYFQGLERDEMIVPEDVPQQWQKTAAGNGVPVNLGYHIGKTILDEVLCMTPAGDGWFNVTEQTPEVIKQSIVTI